MPKVIETDIQTLFQSEEGKLSSRIFVHRHRTRIAERNPWLEAVLKRIDATVREKTGEYRKKSPEELSIVILHITLICIRLFEIAELREEMAEIVQREKNSTEDFAEDLIRRMLDRKID
jgi:hypothetical protein